MGFFDALSRGLERSREALNEVFYFGGEVDEDFWEDLEDTLVMGDMGAEVAIKVSDDLRHAAAHSRHIQFRAPGLSPCAGFAFCHSAHHLPGYHTISALYLTRRKSRPVVTAATKFFRHLARRSEIEYNISCIAMY